MIGLTFGEQVKIILNRRRMTIKRLAETMEEKTGKKMSRQNLTQRLNRDNFQEQDMRLIADILDCSFQLNILDNTMTAQSGAIIPTQAELDKVNKRRIQSAGKHEASDGDLERDVTMGELVDMMNVTETEVGRPAEERPKVKELEEKSESITKTVVTDEETSVEIEQSEPELIVQEAPAPQELGKEIETKKPFHFSKPNLSFIRPGTNNQAQEEEKMVHLQQPEEEDLRLGEVNPYTGHEYESNSVRIHPKRIGYVQVYDRSEHKWTDMTEWAFLGYQERKKALLGEDYEPPIYLD